MEVIRTAVYRKVPDGYTGSVEELPGADTQGETLEKARENLKEAIDLVLGVNRQLAGSQGEVNEVHTLFKIQGL